MCQQAFPQWNDHKWHRLTYHYGRYKDFPESVTVYLSGKDRQSWAGFYGAKFAQVRVRLLYQIDENEASETIIEPRDEDGIIPLPIPQSMPDNLPVDEESAQQSPAILYSSESDTDYEDDA